MECNILNNADTDFEKEINIGNMINGCRCSKKKKKIIIKLNKFDKI